MLVYIPYMDPMGMIVEVILFNCLGQFPCFGSSRKSKKNLVARHLIHSGHVVPALGACQAGNSMKLYFEAWNMFHYIEEFSSHGSLVAIPICYRILQNLALENAARNAAGFWGSPVVTLGLFDLIRCGPGAIYNKFELVPWGRQVHFLWSLAPGQLMKCRMGELLGLGSAWRCGCTGGTLVCWSPLVNHDYPSSKLPGRQQQPQKWEVVSLKLGKDFLYILLDRIQHMGMDGYLLLLLYTIFVWDEHPFAAIYRTCHNAYWCNLLVLFLCMHNCHVYDCLSIHRTHRTPCIWST